MIRFAQPRDLPQLIALWQEAFGESAAEARFYFANRHEDSNMLVFADAAGIDGMFTMLPVTLRIAGQDHPARYVFAVATSQSRRNQGISSRLLEKAHQIMQAEGCVASLLVPATPELFAYYGKRGYEAFFHVDQVTVQAKEIADWPCDGAVKPCGVAEYAAFRNAAFSDCSPFVRWDEKALSFIKLGNELTGGAMVKLSGEGKSAAAVCEDRGGILRVTEFAGNKTDWRWALALLHRRFQANQYQLMLPDTGQPDGTRRPFGMIHWFKPPISQNEGTPYLAFAKD